MFKPTGIVLLGNLVGGDWHLSVTETLWQVGTLPALAVYGMEAGYKRCVGCAAAAPLAPPSWPIRPPARPPTNPPYPPPQLAWCKWLNSAENFFLSLRTAGVAGKRHLLAAEEDPAAAQYRALLLNQMQVGNHRAPTAVCGARGKVLWYWI